MQGNPHRRPQNAHFVALPWRSVNGWGKRRESLVPQISILLTNEIWTFIHLWVASIQDPHKFSIANSLAPTQSLTIPVNNAIGKESGRSAGPLFTKYGLSVLVHCWFSKKGGRTRSLVVSVSWIISHPIIAPFQWQTTRKGCASGVYLSNESRPSPSSWCHCQPVHQMLGLPECHLLVWQDLSLGWSP